MAVRRLLVLLLLGLLARPARGEERPRRPQVGWSIAAGLATALIPMAVGGGLMATAAPDDIDRKRAGVYTLAAGLAVAPIVSHLVGREWKRALIFGAAPLALSAVVVGVLEGSNDILDAGPLASRVAFATFLALELVASGVGLVDSLLAADRHKPRISAAPVVGRNTYGLALGGTF